MSDYKTGVTIHKVGGADYTISSAAKPLDMGAFNMSDDRVVHYVITPPVANGESVTWAATGTSIIRKSDSAALGTIAAKAVTNNVLFSTLIYDQFTDTNKAINLHTIAPTNVPATSWVIGSGTPRIYGNALYLGDSSDNICVLDVGVADHTATCEFSDMWDYYGIIGRYVDINNYWMAYAVDTGSCAIRKVEGGILTNVATGSVSPNIPISIQFSGTLITATFGALTLTYTSSFNQAATKTGLFGNQAHTADNFQVTTP